MANDNFPQICSEVGLSCQECTAGTARQVASLCKGLRGKAIGQLFVQIYPHPACAPAHGLFAEAYRDASMEVAALFERREVGASKIYSSTQPKSMAAVA